MDTMVYKAGVFIEAKHVKVFKTMVSKKYYSILQKLQKYYVAKRTLNMYV